MERIPLFAVGYRGWKTAEAIEERLKDGEIDGVLVIDPGLYVCKPGAGPLLQVHACCALWGLISSLRQSLAALSFTSMNPFCYLISDEVKKAIKPIVTSYKKAVAGNSS